MDGLKTAITALLFALIATPLSATTLTVTGVNYNHGENTYLLENGVDTATYAGEAAILLDDVTSRTAFCVAIFIDISTGIRYNTRLGNITEVANGARVGWLLNNVAPGLTTASQGAGLQMAIWDIVNDNADGFYAGGVRSSSRTDAAALSAAIQYEAMSVGKAATAWVYFSYDMTTGAQVQTLMGYVVMTDGGPTIPEPRTTPLALTGLTVIGLAAFRRSRKRTIHS